MTDPRDPRELAQEALGEHEGWHGYGFLAWCDANVPKLAHALLAALDELDRSRAVLSDKICLRSEDIKELEAHVKALEITLQASGERREELEGALRQLYDAVKMMDFDYDTGEGDKLEAVKRARAAVSPNTNKEE
jgi:hypothetical protein